MSNTTHYETLGVSRTASMLDIKSAYRKILLANLPDKTHALGPFAQSQANKSIRAAYAGWEVLSNPISKRAYDLMLSRSSSYTEYTSDASANASAKRGEGRQSDSTHERAYSNASTDGSNCKEAEYRTMRTANGTILDIKISN